MKRSEEIMGASEKDSTGPSPKDVSRCTVWSTEEPAEEPDHRCGIPDPRADDCPAYMELSAQVRDLRGSIDNLVSASQAQFCDFGNLESRLDDLMALDGRVTAAGHIVAEMLKSIAGLEEHLRSSDAQQVAYYRRTAHRLEALESAKPATFDGLSDVLARLDALESRAGGEGGEGGEGEAHVLRAVTFRELADLDSRVERLEMGTVSEPPRAALRLARDVERLAPNEVLYLGGGWRIENLLFDGWRVSGPSRMIESRHSEASDAVLAWLNRRARS